MKRLLRPLSSSIAAAAILSGAACDRQDENAEVELPVETDTGEVIPPGTVAVVDTPVPRDSSPDGSQGVDSAPDPATRPDSVAGTLVVEGMEEPITLRLYRSPSGFPLPFSAYLADLAPVEQSPDRLVLGFRGGSDAVVELIALPAGTDREAALRRAAERAGAPAGAEGRGDDPAPWPVASHRLEESGRAGRVRLGRHAGRWFLLVTSYPPEYGDGFGPRVGHLLSSWRWSDSGGGLGEGPAG